MVSIQKIVAKNLKDRRKKLGLSQEELAEFVGIERKTISNIETAKASIKSDTLDKICNKLKISPVQLFLSETPISSNDLLAQCIVLLQELDDEKMSYVFKFINSIK